jgi:hypothetical protein
MFSLYIKTSVVVASYNYLALCTFGKMLATAEIKGVAVKRGLPEAAPKFHNYTEAVNAFYSKYEYVDGDYIRYDEGVRDMSALLADEVHSAELSAD